ncbi:MAG: PAS domain S-box protein [Spirochaetaceae bacterium]|nr:MAG: PAS domain S-box protein [Spirochaetaceae bacterium]
MGFVMTRPKTILLVEDESIVALSEEMVLQNAGYAVIVVHDGETAVASALSHGKIDLILMDIDLGPGIDGTESARRILAQRDVPVVFLSSHTERTVVERTEEIGSYGYIVKDSGETVLLASIKMALRLFEANRTIDRRNEELRESYDQIAYRNRLFETTFDSIGDAVITTDRTGRVVRINRVGAVLTGWPQDEAVGRELHEVFRIVNAYTRETVENPVARVLATGHVVGLANHTVLIARDGTEYQVADSAAPIRDESGELHGVVLVFRDVTAEYETHSNLAESRNFLSAVLESVQDGVSVLNPDLTVRYTNNVMKSWYADRAPLEGKKCHHVYHNSDRICDPCPTVRCMRSGRTESVVVPGVPGTDVEWLELFSYPMVDEQTGAVTGIVEFVRDVTHRRRAERQMQMNEQVLTTLVREKSTLMNELQHRVKNSLNIVASLIGIEIDKLHDETARRVFSDARSRIYAMSLMYDRLSDSDGHSAVEIGAFLRDVADAVLGGDELPGRLKLTAELAELKLDTRRAIPIALIVNELLTNVVKYAYPGETRGDVRVEFSVRDTTCRLTVADDGVGFPADISFDNATSTGMTLIKALVEQIYGSITVESDDGVSVTVEFPFSA